PCLAEVCLIWIAKSIEENFGTEIKDLVNGFPKDRMIIHDTATSGRPNVAGMTVKAAKRLEAQVVIVTSNPMGSRDVVKACKAARIPAFGPIWDS
ncbi:Integral membrane protein tmpa, partial [Thalictrum thalictroides]